MAVGAFLAGSIVGKLLLDKKTWDTSVQKVGTDSKKMQSWSQRNAQKFGQMGRTMTVAGAAIVASMGLMVKKYVAAGDEVHKMSLRTGFATETLSELGYAAQIAGTDLGTIEKGIKKMQKTIIDADSGLETYVRSFRRIGIEVSELKKQNPEKQFETLSKAIAGIEDPTMRAATAQEIFGRAGTMLLPMFNEGVEGMEKLKEKAHELGIVFDQEAADKAARLADAQTTLKEAMNGLAITIADKLVPPISNFVEKLSGVITKFGEWDKKFPALTDLIVKLVAALGIFLTIGGPLLILLPHLSAGFGIMKLKLAGLSPALMKVAGVGAAAFIGWKIGRLIGELTGLDKKIQGLFTGLIEKAGKWKGTAELVDDRTRILAKRQELLAAATKKSGTEVTNIVTALKILKGTFEVVDGELKRVKVDTEDAGIAQSQWDEILKKYSIPTATAYKQKLEDLKDKKAVLKQALDAGAITLQTYKEEVGKVKGEIDKLTGATKETHEKQKTWIDYLSGLGLQTIKQKGDKVTELEGYLEDLHKEYRDGKIDLDTYRLAVEATETEISNLSTTLVDTAIPAANQWGIDITAVVPAMDGAISATQDFTGAVETETVKVKSAWSDMADGLQTKWASSFGDILRGTTTFKDALKGMWGSIKDQFFDMIGQMVAKWTFSLITDLASATKTGAAAIGQTLGAAVKSTGAAISGLATGLIALIPALASAIASAATILAAAAPAILVVGAIALGLYAGFKLISGLLSKGKGGQELRAIKDNTWEAKMHLKNMVTNQDFIKEKIAWSWGELKTANAQLDSIKRNAWTMAANLDAIKKAAWKRNNILRERLGNIVAALGGGGKKKSAPEIGEAGGGGGTGDTATQTGGGGGAGGTTGGGGGKKASDIIEDMNGGGGGAGGGSGNRVVIRNMNLRNVVRLEGLIITDKQYTRNRMIPELIAALKANLHKAELQKVLGLTG